MLEVTEVFQKISTSHGYLGVVGEQLKSAKKEDRGSLDICFTKALGELNKAFSNPVRLGNEIKIIKEIEIIKESTLALKSRFESRVASVVWKIRTFLSAFSVWWAGSPNSMEEKKKNNEAAFTQFIKELNRFLERAEFEQKLIEKKKWTEDKPNLIDYKTKSMDVTPSKKERQWLCESKQAGKYLRLSSLEDLKYILEKEDKSLVNANLVIALAEPLTDRELLTQFFNFINEKINIRQVIIEKIDLHEGLSKEDVSTILDIPRIVWLAPVNLSLSGMERIEHTIPHIPRTFPCVTGLDIRNSNNLTPELVEILIKQFPLLQNIDLSGSLTVEQIDALLPQFVESALDPKTFLGASEGMNIQTQLKKAKYFNPIDLPHHQIQLNQWISAYEARPNLAYINLTEPNIPLEIFNAHLNIEELRLPTELRQTKVLDCTGLSPTLILKILPQMPLLIKLKLPDTFTEKNIRELIGIFKSSLKSIDLGKIQIKDTKLLLYLWKMVGEVTLQNGPENWQLFENITSFLATPEMTFKNPENKGWVINAFAIALLSTPDEVDIEAIKNGEDYEFSNDHIERLGEFIKTCSLLDRIHSRYSLNDNIRSLLALLDNRLVKLIPNEAVKTLANNYPQLKVVNFELNKRQVQEDKKNENDAFLAQLLTDEDSLFQEFDTG